MQVIRRPGPGPISLTVLEIVEILYRWGVDLDPHWGEVLGLQMQEWVLELKSSNFGLENIDQISRLETLFAEYSRTSEHDKQEQIKASINSILAKLLRKAKRLP